MCRKGLKFQRLSEIEIHLSNYHKQKINTSIINHYFHRRKLRLRDNRSCLLNIEVLSQHAILRERISCKTESSLTMCHVKK